MTRIDDAPCVLTINGGSSSVRFAVYTAGRAPRRRLGGVVDRIGLTGTRLTVEDSTGVDQARPRRLAGADHHRAVRAILDWIGEHPVCRSVVAVGHRVVHGMRRSAPARVTPALLTALRRITPYDPDHLPREIALIEAIGRRHPRLPQVACFDTAFHRGMPSVATRVPIPRRYAARGVERYGFHGLSCAFLMEELQRLDPKAAGGRVILAHLGSGASLTAVQGGSSVDTTMGFTPASGLVMGTRSGDVDPGLAYFFARTEQMSPARFQRLTNHASGLLGISGTSSDVRDLLAREAGDPRAADALALFCYQVKKGIGAFAAAMGGVDALVFAAGIGEHAPVVRERICDGLGFLGIALHRGRNLRNQPLISRDGGAVHVRVIPTNEEIMIATLVSRLLRLR